MKKLVEALGTSPASIVECSLVFTGRNDGGMGFSSFGHVKKEAISTKVLVQRSFYVLKSNMRHFLATQLNPFKGSKHHVIQGILLW